MSIPIQCANMGFYLFYFSLKTFIFAILGVVTKPTTLTGGVRCIAEEQGKGAFICLPGIWFIQ